MVFELASTNLVAELGIIMVVLLGWQFALAEFIGAPVMVIILVILFRKFLSRQLLAQAREQADRGVLGRMEGHADMDMSVTQGPILARVFSAKGIMAISHYFVMDWALGMAGYRRRSTPRRRSRCLGAESILGSVLPVFAPNPGQTMGSIRRSRGGDHLLCMFSGERAAGGRTLEQRH
jgi:hypothetical protein